MNVRVEKGVVMEILEVGLQEGPELVANLIDQIFTCHFAAIVWTAQLPKEFFQIWNLLNVNIIEIFIIIIIDL